MRSHMFSAGPNMGVVTTASPWEAQKFLPATLPRGTTAWGPNRRWSAGLGSKLGPVGLADPLQPEQPKPHKAADCPVCKVGRTGTLLGSRDPRLGKVPPPPGVCCQKTPDGATVCSDGVGYPAD